MSKDEETQKNRSAWQELAKVVAENVRLENETRKGSGRTMHLVMGEHYSYIVGLFDDKEKAERIAALDSEFEVIDVTVNEIIGHLPKETLEAASTILKGAEHASS